jgi:hypothetical protein
MHLRRFLGWTLVVVGTLITFNSQSIVVPGIASFVGIKNIVGAHNVQYLESGDYIYTNPTAILRWMCGVLLVGIAVALTGLALIRTTRKPKAQALDL